MQTKIGESSGCSVIQEEGRACTLGINYSLVMSIKSGAPIIMQFNLFESKPVAGWQLYLTSFIRLSLFRIL